jgi:hypothetical protein
VGGFAFLSVMFMIHLITSGGFYLQGWVLEGYYIFFTLFMLGVVLRFKYIMEGCGFLKTILPKSIFYAL